MNATQQILRVDAVEDKELLPAAATLNATTRAAMAEAEEIIKSRRARFDGTQALVDKDQTAKPQK